MMLANKNIYSTGNILCLNDLKKKAGLNSRDELIEVLKITLPGSEASVDEQSIKNGIYGSDENIDRKELKLTVKIFLSSSELCSLEEALEQVYNFLQVEMIESMVIVVNKTGVEDVLTSLKTFWTILESYCEKGKLSSIGVSDIDTDKFMQLFNWAKVKPSIIQINLATCCVVPPALQEFTKQNDIQLLTHSDPSPILPRESLVESFGANVELAWVARYQVHLRCRGVLLSKGYLLRIHKT